MKKVRISLAALTLVLAITGTTMANKVQKTFDLCSKVDPKGLVCTGGDTYCCTDDAGNPVFFTPVTK
ncbi:hypothetical protein A3860_22170 [Niastella vici]|uniref:Uncharacterized protein n=1 Tax=Niastella vici TaxID=1703345 RepID=A0A1V9G0G2_9BACT|nr:hypothetical protein [Niastella vici]OQP64115.1 hypothetical protein A3860_22170 [Niastella vici]